MAIGTKIMAALAVAYMAVAVGCNQAATSTPTAIRRVNADCKLEQRVKVNEEDRILVTSGGRAYEVEAEIARGYDNIFIVNGEIVSMRHQSPRSNDRLQNYTPGPETNKRLADGTTLKFLTYWKSIANEAEVEFCIDPNLPK